MLGMLEQAIKGVWEDVRAEPSAKLKVQMAFCRVRILAMEVVGVLSGLNYGVYTKYVWQYFPQQGWNAQLHRDVRYGPAPRNLLDVYLPTNKERKELLPVVMFVHGGAWASGDKFLFSPIGAVLAHHGVLAVLVNYTLHPQALAEEQVKEVSRALTWAMDNVCHYGGDPQKVHLMGHSSGGHVCAMLLWERTLRNIRSKTEVCLKDADSRQPHCFLGLSGVYDIADHYQFEFRRGVASMSCMRPSMGGKKGFPSMSPALLFRSLQDLRARHQTVPFLDLDANKIDWSKLDSLPPALLFCSKQDKVVPPLSSNSLHCALQDLGCKSRVILYENLEHEDFALWVKGWGNDNSNAVPVIQAIFKIVLEERGIDSFLTN